MTAELAPARPAPAEMVRAEASFEDRLRPLLGQAFRLAHAILADHHEAEDAVQEAALLAWRKLDQFVDRGDGMRPWFLAIVANECRRRVRLRWWQVWRRSDLDPGTTIQHEDSVIFRIDLSRVISALTPDQRAALVLRYQLDLSQDQVARVLGVRLGTAKSLLHRAVLRLRALMNEENSKP
jgi:RNA polymerase sigma-70 factor (ECF subfamily)